MIFSKTVTTSHSELVRLRRIGLASLYWALTRKFAKICIYRMFQKAILNNKLDVRGSSYFHRFFFELFWRIEP